MYPFGTKWNLELDNLFVRGNMTVNELTVNEIKAVGGDLLVTLGDMKCTKVETLADGYKCYFDTEDGTKYANNLMVKMLKDIGVKLMKLEEIILYYQRMYVNQIAQSQEKEILYFS